LPRALFREDTLGIREPRRRPVEDSALASGGDRRGADIEGTLGAPGEGVEGRKVHVGVAGERVIPKLKVVGVGVGL